MQRWMPGIALSVALSGCAAHEDTVLRPVEKPMPERISDNQRPAKPVTGEVPADLLSAIKADLARRRKAPVEDIEVLRAQAVLWRDGSLGCPKPGQMYTQALVNGYWVILGLHGKEWDYRAGSKHFALCKRGGQPPLDDDDPRI